MPSGVLDAMVVIGLAKAGAFEHLAALYSPLFLPASVRAEVIGIGATEVNQAVGSWLTVVTPAPAAVRAFAALRSPADRDVLAVAHEQGVDHVLSDDRVVWREAIALGLTCLRTPLLVVLMKHHGEISAVRPILDLMRAQGFGISQGVYEQALVAAGE